MSKTQNPLMRFWQWWFTPRSTDPTVIYRERALRVLLPIFLLLRPLSILRSYSGDPSLFTPSVPLSVSLALFITPIFFSFYFLTRQKVDLSGSLFILHWYLADLLSLQTEGYWYPGYQISLIMQVIFGTLLLPSRWIAFFLTFQIVTVGIWGNWLDVNFYDPPLLSTGEPVAVFRTSLLTLATQETIIVFSIRYLRIQMEKSLRLQQVTIQQLETEITDRQHVEEQLRASDERLEILHEIDRALLSATSLHTIAMGALVRIRKLIPCSRASVSLFDFDKSEGVFLAADLDVGSAIWDHPISFREYGEHIIAELQQNKPFIMNDVLKDPRAIALDYQLAKEGIHSWLYLPLHYQGQLIGALNLGRGPVEGFTATDSETAQDVANQLAIVIQQSRLNQALQIESIEHQNLIAQLEANNAELERFSYTISHDLRSPIVTIKGFLSILDKDLRENKPDQIQRDFQRIAGAADKMDELLRGLLELSRIGRIINPPEEVDLVKLIQDALEMVNAHLSSKNVTVSISQNLSTIYGDRLRLREVLENLISNAAKYMGDQTAPRIEIGRRKSEAETIVYVKDNGMGIEPRFHAKVFGLFEKLSANSEGTGIGLALTKRIIETHGGRIWIESEGFGRGSTFCFTIPDDK